LTWQQEWQQKVNCVDDSLCTSYCAGRVQTGLVSFVRPSVCPVEHILKVIHQGQHRRAASVRICASVRIKTKIQRTVMPDSHRTPDKTRQSCLCCVWCAGVNWTIALNVFGLQISCRRQSRVVGNPIHTAEADATQTRRFCRVWRGDVN